MKLKGLLQLDGLPRCRPPQEFIRLRFGLQPLFHSFFTFPDIIFLSLFLPPSLPPSLAICSCRKQ